MMYGICNLSIVPVRAEPSDRSEMVSQLLLGEHFTILETHVKWVKIQIAWDNYVGWISNKQFDTLSEAQFEELNVAQPQLVADIAHVITHQYTKETLAVVMGSVLPHYAKHAFFLANEAYKYEGSLQGTAPKNLRHALVEASYLYLNSPYLWGGKSPFGIDCSGFTQMVYKLCGVKLLRDAAQQAQLGIPLSFIEEALPGDLAFFDNEEGKIIHVGIVLKGNRIIHASGSVRIDTLDHQGIFNETTKSYTHNLRVIKNIIAD